MQMKMPMFQLAHRGSTLSQSVCQSVSQAGKISGVQTTALLRPKRTYQARKACGDVRLLRLQSAHTLFVSILSRFRSADWFLAALSAAGLDLL